MTLIYHIFIYLYTQSNSRLHNESRKFRVCRLEFTHVERTLLGMNRQVCLIVSVRWCLGALLRYFSLVMISYSLVFVVLFCTLAFAVKMVVKSNASCKLRWKSYLYANGVSFVPLYQDKSADAFVCAKTIHVQFPTIRVQFDTTDLLKCVTHEEGRHTSVASKIISDMRKKKGAQ